MLIKRSRSGFSSLPFRFLTINRFKAFTLAELIIVCAIMATIGGGVSLIVSSSLDRFNDPCSDYNIEREARAAARWIGGRLHEARVLRYDLRLVTSSSPVPRLRTDDSKGQTFGELQGENIAFAAPTTAQGACKYEYSYMTMTPAASIRVYKRSSADSANFIRTKWVITISGHGLVRLSQS